MATIAVYDLEHNKISDIELSDEVFNAEVKEYLIHEAVKIQLANRRAGTVATKNRSEVSGGGKKPFRQKGTGNARQGCSRAPQYPGGGVAFGPQPKIYNLSMNKKARKAALRSALSLVYKNNRLTVMDSYNLGEISTKKFANVLSKFDLNKALLVVDGDINNREIELSARNVKDIKVLRADGLNIFDIMKYKNVILSREAVAKVEGALQS
ncbi:50S ribosomal protein L4 [Geobacter sp. OR-1]|uniref:50S ribosomal protein L4 n=1 Tax=Geobacter sp. OR-1 TaxID=1266765 RepID=UPI000544425B|nr:50S ribosomal protein L4 [Geobacter sp. OR-1]GAM10964.1 50S ribosomal protein L4 [Geobacter sp. OR-1]